MTTHHTELDDFDFVYIDSQSTECLNEINLLLQTSTKNNKKEQFKIAVHLLYKTGAALGISPDKLNAGGIQEMLASIHHGFTQNGAMHGPDAYDKNGKGLDYKNSRVTKKSQKSNFNFKNPEKSRHESRATYIHRVHKHWMKQYPGGVYLNVFEGGAIERSYHIGVDFIAALMREHAKTNSKTYNLGSLKCRACGEYHRAKHFANLSVEYAAMSQSKRDKYAWQSEVFGARIARDACKK